MSGLSPTLSCGPGRWEPHLSARCPCGSASPRPPRLPVSHGDLLPRKRLGAPAKLSSLCAQNPPDVLLSQRRAGQRRPHSTVTEGPGFSGPFPILRPGSDGNAGNPLQERLRWRCSLILSMLQHGELPNQPPAYQMHVGSHTKTILCQGFNSLYGLFGSLWKLRDPPSVMF